MDKIQIKGLVQGKRKLKNGGFAVGFKTKWGTVWVAPGNLHIFLRNNKHLSFLKMRSSVNEKELIGRYIFVTNKATEGEIDGLPTINPCL